MIASPERKARVAVLFDGSALYFASRKLRPDSELNYRSLDTILQGDCAPNWPPRFALFFSSVDDSNKPQMKFLHFLRETVKWTVVPVSPQDSCVINRRMAPSGLAFRHVRFDALIAYSLGRLVGDKSISRIYVVSDSWALSGPVQDGLAKGADIKMVFFGSLADERWSSLFGTSHVPFLDLDSRVNEIFGTVQREEPREQPLLSPLP